MIYNYAAIIACHGRHELLKYTIRRLLQKNGLKHVICVGGPEEESVCLSEGAYFIEHENRPLGKKWNAGFNFARHLNIEGVVFVGSSDWLSDNWMDEITPLMGEYDLVGKPDFYMVDISQTKGYRSCLWEGYGKGDRQYEPIGIGRVISSRILSTMDWEPFNNSANNSMDFTMFNRVKANGGFCKMVTGPHIKSLSVSTDRWPNMHQFEHHWLDKVPSRSVKLSTEYLDLEFPEYKLIFDTQD